MTIFDFCSLGATIWMVVRSKKQEYYWLCFRKTKIKNLETIMVGDREHDDIIGAKYKRD